jgi:hypothetical protein
MYPEINLVAQSGIVRWPSLKYNAEGQPEFRFTLAKSGPYPWSMPCCAIGHTAEKLAGDLDEGMPVLISAAELCYRKRVTSTGEVSRMEILVWHAQVGQPDLAGVAQDERTDRDEGDSPMVRSFNLKAAVSGCPPKRASRATRNRYSVPGHLRGSSRRIRA